MKAAHYTAYGPPDTIAIQDLPIPDPKLDEVLIRVRAAPVTAGDARIRSGVVPRGLGPGIQNKPAGVSRTRARRAFRPRICRGAAACCNAGTDIE